MQRSRVSNHPCHRLSVPSAKRFWCRHCMMVFEDAITRWRHSRSCRSGGFDNYVRRREIETQALQKMAETLDPEMVTQIAVPSNDGSGLSKELCCFICKQRFVSLDEMREHVKYPCNKPTVIHRPPMPLVFPEPTFGTGIQQHYTESPALQTFTHPERAHATASTSNPQAVTVYMNESEQEQPDSEAKPTNIYVNEKGETVIEVENLDLNTKSGELSLAHLLTQLSQQGIVFDQQTQGETEVVTSPQESQVVQETGHEVDFSQPTAVDAANTLTQLAGSAFRSVNNAPEMYEPAVKRIKTEHIEVQYQLEQPDHSQVQTYLQKEEPYEDTSPPEKYIICTNDSEMIRVVRANDVSPESSSRDMTYQNGESVPRELQNTFRQVTEDQVEETVLYQAQVNSNTNTVVLQNSENVPAHGGLTDNMIVVQHNQPQLVTSSGHIIKTEDPATHVIIEEADNASVEHMGELEAVSSYPAHETTVAVVHTAQEAVDVVDPSQESITAGTVVDQAAVVDPSQETGVVDPAHLTSHVVLEPSQETHVVGIVQEMAVAVQETSTGVLDPSVVVDPTQEVAVVNPPQETAVVDLVQKTVDHVMDPSQETAFAVLNPALDTTVVDSAQDPTSDPPQATVVEQLEMVQTAEGTEQCVVVTTSSEDLSSTLASDSVVSSLLEMSGVTVPSRHSQPYVVPEPDPVPVVPQMITVSTDTPNGVPQVILQPPHIAD